MYFESLKQKKNQKNSQYFKISHTPQKNKRKKRIKIFNKMKLIYKILGLSFGTAITGINIYNNYQLIKDEQIEQIFNVLSLKPIYGPR